MNEPDYQLDRAKIFKSLTVSIGEILEDSVDDKATQRILLDRISLKVLDLLSDLKPSNSAKTIFSDPEVAQMGIKAIYKGESGYVYDVSLIGISYATPVPQAYFVDKCNHISCDIITRFEVLGVPKMSDRFGV